MSRTDVHRPKWVQDHDPHLAMHMYPEHNHWVDKWYPCTHEPQCTPGRWETVPGHRVRRVAPCDLEVFLATQAWVKTRCHMVYRGGRNLYCGCRLCTGTRGRKYTRRRERAAWRAESRLWVKGGEPRPPKDLRSWM